MSVRRILILVFGALMACAAAGLPSPAGAVTFHGIAFAKGCNTPIVIGQLYTCDVLTVNNIDTGPDTLTITAVIDVVHAGAGDQTSPNLLPTLTLGFTGGASCNVGHTLCTLPPGSSIFSTTSYGFYISLPTDPNPLADTATLTWQDLCNSHAPNCPIGDQHASSGSSAALVTPTPTLPPPPAVPVGGFTDVQMRNGSAMTAEQSSGRDSLMRRGLGFGAVFVAVGLIASSGIWYARRREQQ